MERSPPLRAVLEPDGVALRAVDGGYDVLWIGGEVAAVGAVLGPRSNFIEERLV